LEESFHFLKKTQFYLVINLGERKFFMVGILQVFVFLLVIVSFAMVVAVPVILATPGEWEKSQSVVWSGAGLWSALVILTGIFNTVPA
jgi:photosystem II core protein PsbZ